jgi:hypothetical protein
MKGDFGKHALISEPLDYAGAVSALLAQGNVQGVEKCGF